MKCRRPGRCQDRSSTRQRGRCTARQARSTAYHDRSDGRPVRHGLRDGIRRPGGVALNVDLLGRDGIADSRAMDAGDNSKNWTAQVRRGATNGRFQALFNEELGAACCRSAPPAQTAVMQDPCAGPQPLGLQPLHRQDTRIRLFSSTAGLGVNCRVWRDARSVFRAKLTICTRSGTP